MRKRSRMSSSHSKKVFHKTAKRVHHRNHSISPMRGGIRL
jgi:hypothetical protein